MVPHDCTRQVEVLSFIEKETGKSAKSGFYLDRYFRKRRTRAEKLETRLYTKGNIKPLFYVGACMPPNLVKNPKETLVMKEFKFPTIRAEAQITGCDVDDRRITPDGMVLNVGMDRYDEAVNWGMMPLIEGVRQTHICEAINLLKTGGYVLHETLTGDQGTIDYCRDESLKDIDLSGTDQAWNQLCSKPLKTIESILRAMRKCKGVAGEIDIHYSELAWEWMEAHSEREAIKYKMPPALPTGFNEMLVTEYDDVSFKGTTNGTLNHFVSNACYIDHAGEEVDVLAPGEIMIIARGGFDGQRICRTLSANGREELPDGAEFFLYADHDDPQVYDKKCETYKPWLTERHLMAPGNPNGAVVVRVVPEDATDICVSCDVCPPAAPVKKEVEAGADEKETVAA